MDPNKVLYVIISAVFILLFNPVVSGEDPECIASYRDGTVIGAVADTLDESKKICSFTAIPYAAPPLGNLRFKAPQAPAAFGTFNATRQPNWCPQASQPPSGSGIQISEDCLYLNVYQPQIPNVANANLPVMIWIHGGGFILGSAYAYPPQRLLSRGDIILVAIHYRLGLLGFFSTGDHHAPGNWGLKDQAFAIRWVSDNIKAFGGNPNQITIFGQSAGGSSVAHQMITPLNQGLLKGAIAQSGSALATWAVDRDPAASARNMGWRLGCPPLSNSFLVACLRFLDWRLMVAGQTMYQLLSYASLTYPKAGATPVVEPNLPGAFITKEPLHILTNGPMDNFPVMIGATKHDGSFVLSALYQLRWKLTGETRNPDYMRNKIVPDLIKMFEIDEPKGNRVVASSTELAYLNGVDRSSWNASMPGLVDIVSVFAFKSSILHTADLLSKRGNKVYLYSFEHHSNQTVFEADGAVNGGVAHADDNIYLFHDPKGFSEDDKKFATMFTDMWINFGRNGSPTPIANQDFPNWPSYDESSENYMKLSVSPAILKDYKTSWRPNGLAWN